MISVAEIAKITLIWACSTLWQHAYDQSREAKFGSQPTTYRSAVKDDMNMAENKIVKEDAETATKDWIDAEHVKRAAAGKPVAAPAAPAIDRTLHGVVNI